MRVIIEAIQPVRLELADLAAELLHRKDIPERHKKIITMIVENAFDWKFMIVMVGLVPAFAFMRARGGPLSDPFDDIHSPKAREKMGRFVELFAKSTAAANPVVFILVGIEFLLLFMVLRLMRALNGDQVRTVVQRAVLRAEEKMAKAA
jgi:hypothetical protein